MISLSTTTDLDAPSLSKKAAVKHANDGALTGYHAGNDFCEMLGMAGRPASYTAEIRRRLESHFPAGAETN